MATLGDTSPTGVRRSHALGLLAHPQRTLTLFGNPSPTRLADHLLNPDSDRATDPDSDPHTDQGQTQGQSPGQTPGQTPDQAQGRGPCDRRAATGLAGAA